MEEIKVGEYVRTKKGKVYKVTNVYVLKITCGHTSLRYDDIKKHSPNIIDLIEVGDYVNGEKVAEIYGYDEDGNDKDELGVGEIDCEDVYYIPLTEIDIKSIVTHEQFEAAKYEVNHASNIT